MSVDFTTEECVRFVPRQVIGRSLPGTRAGKCVTSANDDTGSKLVAFGKAVIKRLRNLLPERRLPVTEAVVHPDRIELTSPRGLTTIMFGDIAHIRWAIGRDACGPPVNHYLRFEVNPPITVYMPDDASEPLWIRRAQRVMRLGGFETFDLG